MVKKSFLCRLMSLYIASLNSGSNGNCYYIGNNNDAILIDAGLSCKETEKRMLRLGLSPNKIRAVFISHEHTDHIKGLEVLSRKYALPVYISAKTLGNSHLRLEHHLLCPLTTNEKITLKEFQISAFAKYHDAAEPCSFMVESLGIKIGIFTDIGRVCEQLIHHFSQCHAAFLEANYDEEMLEHGRYPFHLKRRISGGKGHLSNREAFELFCQHRPVHMSHVLLSHLSQDNNCPDLARRLFESNAGNVQVSIASRHKETELICISGNFETPVESPYQEFRFAKQSSLF